MSPAPEELPLGRLAALSDGVFAIAITLLVLELAVSANAGEHLLRSILHEWLSYLAYVTSFLTIGVVWLQHSNITGAAARRRRHALPPQPARTPARLVPALPDEAGLGVHRRGGSGAGCGRLLPAHPCWRSTSR
jgi:hypothetical protein